MMYAHDPRRSASLQGLACLLLLLPACGYVQLDKSVAMMNARVNSEIQQLTKQTPESLAVRTLPGNWIGSTAIQSAEQVPPILQQAIRLATSEPHTIAEIASRITWKTGIPVRVDPDLYTTYQTETDIAYGVVSEHVGLSPLTAIRYRHEGSIQDFLDTVTARLGIVWRYEDRQIHLARLSSRLFTIHLLPGTAQSDATVGGQIRSDTALASGLEAGNGTTGQLSGGNSDEVQQTTDISSSLDRWGELIDAVASLLSSLGRLSASPSIGTILVTDTPVALHRIERFIDDINAQLIRQIALNVHIFSVSGEAGAEAGLNWELIFNNDRFRTRLLSPTLSGNTGTISLGVIEPRDSTGNDFAGTTAIIQALNNQSNLSTLTSANLITLNNQPAPVQVTRSVGYLRSISNVVTGTTGVSETTLEPGRVTSGFVMTVTPRILAQDHILLRFAADLSSLLGFSSQVSSGARIQTPETDERAFLQEVIMRSGQSLVLSGFEQISSNRQEEGLGRARNWLAGTGKLGQAKTRILIVISPTLIGDQHGPA